MSHKRTVIEPAEGLTVLSGPNNCGKSAVVVALQCMNTCDNRSAPFIRHGEKEARVTIDTAEGSRVEWVRGKNFTNYKINGREMTRARKPEDLDDVLKLAEVQSEDGKKTFDLHFADQKSPIFLLNESGAAAATFFAASSDAAYLVQMQSLLKRKESESRSRKRDLEARIDRQKKQLNAFHDLPAIEGDVRRAESSYADLVSFVEKAKQLKQTLFNLSECALDRQACAADEDALTPLSAPPEIAPTEGLARLVVSLDSASRRRALEAGRHEALSTLTSAPEIPDPTPLASLIEAIDGKTSYRDKIAAKTAISETAPKPPEQEDPSGLAELVAAYENRTATIKQAASLVRSVGQEVDEAKRALLEYLKENPTCPVCGSLIATENMLKG